MCTYKHLFGQQVICFPLRILNLLPSDFRYQHSMHFTCLLYMFVGGRSFIYLFACVCLFVWLCTYRPWFTDGDDMVVTVEVHQAEASSH